MSFIIYCYQSQQDLYWKNLYFFIHCFKRLLNNRYNCSLQTSTSNSGVVAGTGPGGWVPLPPPLSPHFRTEFPSLEAAAQPSHRSSDHSTPQPQLRPQSEKIYLLFLISSQWSYMQRDLPHQHKYARKKSRAFVVHT